MAQGLQLETLHFAKGIDPVADALDGTKFSDVYSLRDHESIIFIMYFGEAATGVSLVKVNSCDNITPSTRTEMPFYWREVLATDVQGDISKAVAATGFSFTAGSSKLVLIEARAEDLVDGDGFVELDLVESTADTDMIVGVMAVLGQGRYKEDVSATVLA